MDVVHVGAALANEKRYAILKALFKGSLQTCCDRFEIWENGACAADVVTVFLPSQWLLAMFGRGRYFAVPLAATAGLPLYINAEVSMPLIGSFMTAGMSPGAALALIITGAGTSVGAISGAFIIARRRVVGLIVGSLWVGAVVAGCVYNVVVE